MHIEVVTVWSKICGKKRFFDSEMYGDSESSIQKEVSDSVPAMPIFNSQNSERRQTRSQGRVEAYPNVQLKTLEYKRRKPRDSP